MPLHLPYRTDQGQLPSKGVDSKLGQFRGSTVSKPLQVQPWMRTSTYFWAALNIDIGHSFCAGVKPSAWASHPSRSKSFPTALQKVKAWKTGGLHTQWVRSFHPNSSSRRTWREIVTQSMWLHALMRKGRWCPLTKPPPLQLLAHRPPYTDNYDTEYWVIIVQ